ncbi:hypothetical protein FAM18105_02065 [Lacticaseibacillus paracasei]|nr:hypothetical protein FAM18101_02287 [Lacticaseibacillus paracasei]RND43449.1 hypothetical protein FAM18105_02065 [Lacticaseibacillus paracasei]
MSTYKADRTRQYIYIALLCAQGVIIGLLERMIPFPFAFAPGGQTRLSKPDYHHFSVYDVDPRQFYPNVSTSLAHHPTWRHAFNIPLQRRWCRLVLVWHAVHQTIR